MKSKQLLSKKRGAQQAFTLVEMLLVLVILATLAAIVIPKFAGRGKEAKITSAKTQISNFESAIDTFENDNSYFPQNGDLDALVNAPANARDWKGPYLKNIPVDPWGHPYIYEYPGKHNVNSYDISSMGPDEQSGTDDDINNWDANKK